MKREPQHPSRHRAAQHVAARGALIFILACAVASACGATECTPEQIIGGGGWDYYAGRPSIDVGPEGTAWVVWGGSDSAGELFWFANQGGDWSEPAEFVIFRISQYEGGSEASE